MIIYGRRAAHLKSGQLTNLTCPSCATPGATTISIFAQYAHIFWIPFFSLGRTGVSQCQHCKKAHAENEMPPVVKSAYQNMLKETRIPLWSFVGLAVVGVMIAFGAYSSEQTSKKEEAYFNAPAVGDVYEVRVEKDFTTFKVVAVSNDSLSIMWNNFAVNKGTGLYKIEKDENYTETVSIARTEVAEMKKASNIYAILRSTSK